MSSVRIIGLDKVKGDLNKYSEKVKMGIRGVLANAAGKWAGFAQRDAPIRKDPIVGNGTYGSNLKQQITSKQINPYLFEVVSGAKYSAYLEWGTVTKVSVPAELADYAIQFKGKGIVKTGGIKPQPFFFKQMPRVEKIIMDDLKQLFE